MTSISDEAFAAAVVQAEMTRQVAIAAATTPGQVTNADIAYFNAVIAAGVTYNFDTPAAVDALAGLVPAQQVFVTDDSGQFLLTTDNSQHLVFITEG